MKTEERGCPLGVLPSKGDGGGERGDPVMGSVGGGANFGARNS